MKWLILLALLTGYPQAAQAVFWFQFTPCGFKEYRPENKTDPLYTQAPNLNMLLWRIPPTAIIQIVGIRSEVGDIRCSWLAVNGDQWLVVGTPREIYELLAVRRVPEFKDIEK